MAMATKDPLAPGVYWIDLFPEGPSGDGDAIFHGWASSPPGAVTIISQERGAEANVRLFTVFEVNAAPAPSPGPFPRSSLGSPTIQKLASAPGGITPADTQVTSDQTQQSAPPGGLGDWISEQADKIKAAAEAVAPELLIGGLAVYFFLNQKNRRRD